MPEHFITEKFIEILGLETWETYKKIIIECFPHENTEIDYNFFLRWRQALSQTITIGNVTIPGIPFDYTDKLELDELVEVSMTRKRQINQEIKRYNEYMKEQEKHQQ